LFEDDTPVEMAEGGYIAAGDIAQMFRPGFLSPQAQTGAGSTVTKTFVNAAGEIRSIMFVNGQPLQTIPAGFVEDTPENRANFEAQATASAPSTTTADSGGRDRDRSTSVQAPRVTADGDRGSSGFGSGLNEEDTAALNDNPLKFGMDALSKGPYFDAKRLSGIGTSIGALGGPGLSVLLGGAGAAVGGRNELQDIAKARAALEIAKSRGLQDSPEYAALKRDLDKELEGLSIVSKGSG